MLRQGFRILTIAAAFVMAIPGSLVGADFFVSTTIDTNDGICDPPFFPCSLRDAILTANAHPGFDIVHVPAGTFRLTIGGVGEDAGLTGDLDVHETVMIVGAGSSSTVIDAQELDRAMHIDHSGGWVYLNDLTIRNGNSSNDPVSAHGGGVAAHGGAVWIERCRIEDNTTDNGHGGGLYQRQGTLALVDAAVLGNHAQGGSGLAVYSAVASINTSTFAENYATDFDLIGTGGSIWFADSDTWMLNSTIADNNSRLIGQSAGIFVHGGETDIASCTLVNNDGDEIFSDPADPPLVLTLGNSVILGTCNGLGITTVGGNVNGPQPGNTCQLGVLDLGGRSIALHPLGRYGGETPTMPPVAGPGSFHPAVDNPFADPLCASYDQRGILRPQPGHAGSGVVCDSGAVEYRGLIFADGFDVGSTIRWSSTTP